MLRFKYVNTYLKGNISKTIYPLRKRIWKGMKLVDETRPVRLNTQVRSQAWGAKAPHPNKNIAPQTK